MYYFRNNSLLMHRYLSIQGERRRPSEQAALDVWLAMRPNLLSKALLNCDVPPALDAQIENIDRVMEDVFNLATAKCEEHNLDFLFEHAMSRLQQMWTARRAEIPVRMAGSWAMPEFDSDLKQSMQLDYLR